MKIRIFFISLMVAILTPSHSYAAISTWDSEAELGAVITSGNTETQTLTAKAKSVRNLNQWRYTLNGSAINTADQNRTTSEKYEAGFQADYKLDDISYIFGALHFESDRFGGYKYRWRELGGYGRELHRSDSLNIKGELGLGARQSKLINNGTDKEIIAKILGALVWNISQTATLTEEASIEGGRTGFVSKSITALENKIVGNVSSKITFTARHTSQVPAGRKKLDTETALTLLLKF